MQPICGCRVEPIRDDFEVTDRDDADSNDERQYRPTPIELPWPAAIIAIIAAVELYGISLALTAWGDRWRSGARDVTYRAGPGR